MWILGYPREYVVLMMRFLAGVGSITMSEYGCSQPILECLAALERARIECMRIIDVVFVWAVVMVLETNTGRCGR